MFVPLFYPARESMTITDDKLNQMFEYFRQALKGDAEPVNANPPSTPDRASDFIPATHVYEHEKAYRQQPQSINDWADVPTPTAPNTFTPVVEPAPVQQSVVPEPPFSLTGLEPDLVKVLQYSIEKKGQTLYTVENVFLQQLLRIFLRLEAKMDGLEELISDELLGVSKDDQPQPQSQLVFQSHGEEEEETEEKVHVQIGQNTFVDDGERIVSYDVPRSSGKPPKEKGNAGKRRRRKRNRKNKR